MKRAVFFILLILLVPSSVFSKNPSVYGIRLMTNEAKFLAKNPNCTKNTSKLSDENILLDGMDIYDIIRDTDNGRQVTINCCFHKSRLAVIIVNYDSSGQEILQTLRYKYGTYSSHVFRRERDTRGAGYKIRETARWASDDSILIFTGILETEACQLILANSAAQDNLKMDQRAYLMKKLE